MRREDKQTDLLTEPISSAKNIFSNEQPENGPEQEKTRLSGAEQHRLHPNLWTLRHGFLEPSSAGFTPTSGH